MIEFENVSAYYGNVRALDGISLSVEEGSVATVIGANGAGKSTLLKAALGLVRPRGGKVTYEGRRIDNRYVEKNVADGIALVPEGRQIFPSLTVRENLQLGAYVRRREAKRETEEDYESVFSLFPVLKEREDQSGGTLSGGEQQMLAIGRALMARPRLLLLDEPSLGLAPLVIRDIFKVLKKLNEEGLTILLVEQDAKIALSVADKGYVLQGGSMILEDTAAKLIESELVKEIYFGKNV